MVAMRESRLPNVPVVTPANVDALYGRGSILSEIVKAKNPRKAPRRYVAKASVITIGDQTIRVRSNAEANHANYLETLKRAGLVTSWKYEPRTFYFPDVKRGSVSYKPDFEVVSPDSKHPPCAGGTAYHEVKGYWDRKSIQKLRLMARHYPEVVIVTFGSPMKREDRESIDRARGVGRRAIAKAEKRSKNEIGIAETACRLTSVGALMPKRGKR